MLPKEASKEIKLFSRHLGLKERLLAVWRPRICPFHIIMEHIPHGSKVLDIGCGNGIWLLLLMQTGKISSGIGVDTYTEKIEVANNLKQDDKLAFMKVEPNDIWPGQDCDCITMIDVLHHVPKGKQKEFIQKIETTDVKRIVFKDIDPQAKFKSFMNTVHDMTLSRQKPVYCEMEKAADWLQEMGFKIIHKARHDMLWYSHYLIVGERS